MPLLQVLGGKNGPVVTSDVVGPLLQLGSILQGLQIEEAPLTGESVPVDKGTAALSPVTPLADRCCMAYSGTLVTHGQGTGIVVATGAGTEIGRISAMLAEVQTMEMLKETAGVVGYQILKRIGLSVLGSGHATVESMLEDLKDSSGSKLRRTAEVWEGYSLPVEYLVMVEWENLRAAQRGMPHVNVKPEILFVHGPKVLNNLIRLPTLRISESMFTEHSFREILQGNR